jgi:hypothetical protein
VLAAVSYHSSGWGFVPLFLDVVKKSNPSPFLMIGRTTTFFLKNDVAQGVQFHYTDAGQVFPSRVQGKENSKVLHQKIRFVKYKKSNIFDVDCH